MKTNAIESLKLTHCYCSYFSINFDIFVVLVVYEYIIILFKKNWKIQFNKVKL